MVPVQKNLQLKSEYQNSKFETNSKFQCQNEISSHLKTRSFDHYIF